MLRLTADGDTLKFLTNAERALAVAQTLAVVLGSAWIGVLVAMVATEYGRRNRYVVYSIGLVFLFLALMTSARNLGVRLSSLSSNVAEDIADRELSSTGNTRVSLIRSDTLRDLLSSQEY